MQDLFTQLLVILFLKQIIGNLLEVGLPLVHAFYFFKALFCREIRDLILCHPKVIVIVSTEWGDWGMILAWNVKQMAQDSLQEVLCWQETGGPAGGLV